MSTDHVVLAVSVVLVAVTLTLSSQVNIQWIWLTMVILANLARVILGGSCFQASLYERLGVRRGDTFTRNALATRNALDMIGGQRY
ncbi:MAG: hypothetical protein HQL37_02170 [Alphaproteobacteria bacterium]|nr:hypothetical protein [Alphaproteobacteria bacterium]